MNYKKAYILNYQSLFIDRNIWIEFNIQKEFIYNDNN